MTASAAAPRILVFSSLFPSPAQPGAGLFIRERMFRVARRLPLSVVSPRPSSPLDGLIRLKRPHYRPPVPRQEQQQGIEVRFPRFPSLPGIGRQFDGDMMAIGCLPLLQKMRDRFDIIDAHFAYPDGYAATKLGRGLDKPVSITLRGTEPKYARDPKKRKAMQQAFNDATHIFCVAGSLAKLAAELGADERKLEVIGNGVDTDRFRPLDRAEQRARLGIPPDAPVLVSVGGLVERKGFHRVIEQLPRLIRRYPGLIFLIIGGSNPEGDYRPKLDAQIAELGIEEHVRFLGQIAPDYLAGPLSAADVFTLATSNEGWANVFLEAMACGLPVVTTDVGGNPEVVEHAGLGSIVPFGDGAALQRALDDALLRDWDRAAIRAHAEANTWDGRVDLLETAFRNIASAP